MEGGCKLPEFLRLYSGACSPSRCLSSGLELTLKQIEFIEFQRSDVEEAIGLPVTELGPQGVLG